MVAGRLIAQGRVTKLYLTNNVYGYAYLVKPGPNRYYEPVLTAIRF